tara:strand:+ start:60 stop:515 length:456 start_codon:yes stop_codon:yes gene_type:complete
MQDLPPNYSSYSNGELLEALGAIDKSQFPERVSEIKAELSKRKTQTEATIKQKPLKNESSHVPNILTKTDGKIVHFIIRVWCIGLIYFPSSRLCEAFTAGTIYVKRHGDMTLAGEPIIFSFEVFKSVAVAVVLIFCFVKNPFSFFNKSGKA